MKETLKNIITKAGIPLVVVISSIAATPENSASLFENLSDFDKAGITFLLTAEAVGVTLLGYRFSEGTKNSIEKYGWLVAVPATNFAGATFLLGNMWL